MPNHNKRTAWSVQDVANGRASTDSRSGPKFKSGYSGPKKQSSAVMDRYSSRPSREPDSRGREMQRPARNREEVSARPRAHAGYKGAGSGILDYAWIVYCAILGLCLMFAVIVYSRNAGKYDGYRYPSYVFSMNGVLNRIYDDYVAGGLGSTYNKELLEAPADNTDNLLGNSLVDSTLPNTTTGATMALDTGSTYKDYGMALSYSELLEQIKKALESNDYEFVGMKLSYEDAESGSLIGYPQSVVEHFTQYMSDNSGKRELFLDNIKDESKYMVKNGSAFLVKLPILQFTINMGYDNTNVSVSGFSDRKMDAGQSAVVSPLLPCMYTINVATDEGSQSSEVECDMGEGNLQVNIGVTN